MIKKSLTITVLATLMLAVGACSADRDPSSPDVENPTPEPPTPIKKQDLLGSWDAAGYRYDLENGNSKCYLMDAAGTDFEYDDQGNYITISIKEYCELWARDYNADPKNTMSVTPEMVADHPLSGTYQYTNISVSEDEIVITAGQKIPEQGTLTITVVKGRYSYNEEESTLTVQDMAIESDPRELKIKVFKDKEGMLNFRYSDFDIFTAYSYDKSKSYWVYAPMIFYCEPGTPFAPQAPSTQNMKRLKTMPKL